jgi:hypothetical protein
MAHFFPLLVILIVVVSKIIAASQKQGEFRPPTSTPQRTPTPDSEEERMRKFMEIVGLPPGATPPPPVQRRPAGDMKPLLPVRPPGLPTGVPGRLRRVHPTRPTEGAGTRGTTVRIYPPNPTPEPAVEQSEPAPAVLQPAPAATRAPVVLAAMEAFPQSGSVAVPAIGAAAVGKSGAQLPQAAAGLLLRLRDPRAVREAIILREVLGPPKAFPEGLTSRILELKV